MAPSPSDPRTLLRRTLESGRVHSAYLLSGPGDEPREAALDFTRGLVCSSDASRPCEECLDCRKSSPGEEIEVDGTGRKGPLLRHVGDHADLFWVERGPGDTRVRIGQIRALQAALRLRTTEGGRRAAVIADAEWMNQEAQNALLRVLEEPPPQTTLVLVTTTSAGLLATVRSRCQRLAFPRTAGDDDPERAATAARLERVGSASVSELLEWAEEFRGARAVAAEQVHGLLDSASGWLRDRVIATLSDPAFDTERGLDAFRTIGDCRKTLDQRNANPQMVAERALFALREARLR